MGNGVKAGTLSKTIAALFVEKKGAYSGLDFVDLWDIERDARSYAGPFPVVAHPPCARWCRLAGLVQARWGHQIGDDGGAFESALYSVRKWGGVLEHPAASKAFYHFGLPIPHPLGGWQRGICGGWSCYVEQGNYGHPAKKATWLYCYGVEPPPLRWGMIPDKQAGALVSWCGNKVKHSKGRQRISKKAASATPPAFRDVLLSIALNKGNLQNGAQEKKQSKPTGKSTV